MGIRSLGILLAVVLLLSPAARGSVIFQTSSAPGPAVGSGVLIYGGEYLGVRFQVAQETTMNQVGLRMTGLGAGVGSIFGAIVRLSSMSDFPDSTHSFNTPDILATTLLPIPNSTADVTAEIGPLTVPAGTYALVFGSGEFGATGEGTATQNNTPIGPQSYFFWAASNGFYVDNNVGNVRFYVLNEIPEPSSAAALMIGVIATGALSRHPRRL